LTTPTLPPVADRLAAQLLLELRDCLCIETQKTLSGPVCRCYVAWDQGVPVMNGCACECATENGKGVGDAWVRLVSVAPNLGQGITGSSGSVSGWDATVCFLGWIATIELGIVRCHPQPEDPAQPLAAQTNTDVSLWRMSDFAAMRRAWRCCPALVDLTSLPVLFSPLGVMANCSGGTFTINVELSDVDICGDGNP